MSATATRGQTHLARMRNTCSVHQCKSIRTVGVGKEPGCEVVEGDEADGGHNRGQLAWDDLAVPEWTNSSFKGTCTYGHAARGSCRVETNLASVRSPSLLDSPASALPQQRLGVLFRMRYRLPLELELTILEFAAPPLAFDCLHDRVAFLINVSLAHRFFTAWAQERLHDQFLYTYRPRSNEHERLKMRLEAGFALGYDSRTDLRGGIAADRSLQRGRRRHKRSRTCVRCGGSFRTSGGFTASCRLLGVVRNDLELQSGT